MAHFLLLTFTIYSIDLFFVKSSRGAKQLTPNNSDFCGFACHVPGKKGSTLPANITAILSLCLSSSYGLTAFLIAGLFHIFEKDVQ
jgi:hypothetical protein